MKKNAKQKFVESQMKNKGIKIDEQDSEEEDEMTPEEFINEHERLIKILRSGTKEEQLAEADKQEKELEEFKSEQDEND